MIDKYIIKFLEAIDKLTDYMTNFLFTQRCKCKKRNEDS